MKKHKTELREFRTARSYCVQPGCKFHGRLAQQGVCFDAPPDTTAAYIKQTTEHGTQLLREMQSLRKVKKQQGDKALIRHLEGHVVVEWANHWFMLDELIYLRAENAKLRAKARARGK